MKIVIATGIFPPQIGGPATYSKKLLERLPTLGHEVTVVNYGDFLSYPKIIRHCVYGAGLFLRSRGADVIYAQDPVSVGLPAAIVARLTGKKFLLKIVGDYAWEQGSQRFSVTEPLDLFASHSKGVAWQVRMFKKIQTFVARQAMRIVVPSNYLKTIVQKWGIDETKITVIYNGFTPPKVGSAENEREISKKIARENLGLDEQVKMVLSIGRLVPWKGFSELISASNDISEKINNLKLFIAGSGPMKERLSREAQTFKVPVVFLDQLSQEKLFEYIMSADVFVLNTAYEGFSHQLLEVMALGTPIVTTRVGGNSELIQNGEEGVLIEPNDKQALCEAIINLLTNHVFAEKLISQGRKKVTMFTDERMMREFDTLLKTIF